MSYMKKATSQPSHQGFLWFALLVSLGLNVYWFLTPKDDSQQILASAGNENFRRLNLSQDAEKKLTSLDRTKSQVLKKEAETWVENIILPKEAQSRGKTVQQLLEEEVTQKIQINQDEVAQRLAHSPGADTLPYPQVLKDIENDLRNSRTQSVKKSFLESLYPKYQVEFKISSSQKEGLSGESLPLERFPLYEPPMNNDPSKGPADAPAVIEIYSDFMCPFSARFFGTMKEAEKQYPGKIRTIYHQFPLPFHVGSHEMSEASLCAQEQGKFWEFHDRLMGKPEGKKDKTQLTQIAQELGLDASKFQACLDSNKYVERVDQDIALGKSEGVTGTPGYMIDGRLGTGAIPFESLKPLIDWCLKPQGQYPGKQNPSPSAPGAGTAPKNALDPGKVYALAPEWLKKSPSRGPENAPVTIVEFVDYNCPFCQKGSTIIEDLVSKHPGQIRLISKEFPLSMHPNAMKAAIATACAAEQGKFWEYQKELYGPSWGKQSVEDLKAAAKKVGVQEKDFNACLDQDKTKDRVDEDMKMAGSLGVQGTPTFFVNGKPMVGAQPVENFEKAIDAKK